MRGLSHSPETKAAAVAALLAGDSVTEIARRFDLPRASVNNWRRELAKNDSSFLELTAVNRKKDEFGALLETYLQKTLDALVVQAGLFGNPDWLQKQDASSLAVLHGVQIDKTIRLLEAAERATELHTVRMVERSFEEEPAVR